MKFRYSLHKSYTLGHYYEWGVRELGSIHLVDLYSLNSRSIANKTYCTPNSISSKQDLCSKSIFRFLLALHRRSLEKEEINLHHHQWPLPLALQPAWTLLMYIFWLEMLDYLSWIFAITLHELAFYNSDIFIQFLYISVIVLYNRIILYIFMYPRKS